MRARLATKKLKQLLSPAVQVDLEIDVFPAHVTEPPVPPVLEPPVPLPPVPPP
jgi:hypothetical protein